MPWLPRSIARLRGDVRCLIAPRQDSRDRGPSGRSQCCSSCSGPALRLRRVNPGECLGALIGLEHAVADERENCAFKAAGQANPGLICNDGNASEAVELPEEGHCPGRSEEHTSELQSLMRNSYAVFCLKKKKNSK